MQTGPFYDRDRNPKRCSLGHRARGKEQSGLFVEDPGNIGLELLHDATAAVVASRQ